MNRSEAVVARVEGEYAWLEVCKPEDCASCGSSGGCGVGASKRLLQVRNTMGARVGDRLLIAVPDGAVFKAAALAYLVPLAAGLAGAAAGSALAGDAGALAGLIVGLVGGWLGLKRADRRIDSSREPMVDMQIKPQVVQLHRNQNP